MKNSKPNLGSAKKVADWLNCHVATVWRQVANGTLPQPIRIDGRTLWNLDEIDALIETKLSARRAA